MIKQLINKLLGNKKERGITIVNVQQPVGNAIMTIDAYLDGRYYYFDEPRMNIYKEGFVGNTEKVIGETTGWAPNVRLMFSGDFFPGYNVCAVYSSGDSKSGTYYTVSQGGETIMGMEFWLCQVLHSYFNNTPSTIYAKIEAI